MKKIIKIVTALVVSVLTISLIVGCSSNKEDRGTKENTQNERTDTITELPNKNTLTEEEPLMKDYLDGFIGYRFKDAAVSQGGSQVYAFSENMENVYVSTYDLKDIVGIIPNLGNKPVKTSFKYETFAKLKEEFKENYPSQVFTEKDYTFIIVNNYEKEKALMLSKGVNWEEEESRVEIIPGDFYEKYISTGMGYPTEILREEPYSTGLADIGVDIHHKWWDTYSYSSISFYENEEEEIYTVTSPRENNLSITSPQGFVYSFVNNAEMSSQEQLEQYIKDSKLTAVSIEKAKDLIEVKSK